MWILSSVKIDQDRASCIHQVLCIKCFFFDKSLNTLIGAVAIAVFWVVLMLIAVRVLRSRWRCLWSIVVVVRDDWTWRDCVSGIVCEASVIIVIVRIIRLLWVVLRWRNWRIGIGWIRRWWSRTMLNLIRLIIPVVLLIWILIVRFIIGVVQRSLRGCRRRPIIRIVTD